MAHHYDTSDFRNNLKVEMDGSPYLVVYFQFVKPGKGTAFTRTKLKNMITGAVLERTFRTGEKIKAADIEEFKMQFLYSDDEFHHFMNNENFEQLAVESKSIAHEAQFLTENLEVEVLLFNGNPISIALPNFIESEIVFCEPGLRGNTATGVTKPAELECGARVQVPLFVEQGETVKVDTRTGEYSSRVKN
jgi:elongation factor P